nr:uncharacterized protein LOC111990537 [Ipomoea trifida]
MTAASFASATARSWARDCCSLLSLSISCFFQASSLAILSRSHRSIASRNFFCRFSCFSRTSFISFSKYPASFLSLLLLAELPPESFPEEYVVDVDADRTSAPAPKPIRKSCTMLVLGFIIATGVGDANSAVSSPEILLPPPCMASKTSSCSKNR